MMSLTQFLIWRRRAESPTELSPGRRPGFHDVGDFRPERTKDFLRIGVCLIRIHHPEDVKNLLPFHGEMIVYQPTDDANLGLGLLGLQPVSAKSGT